MATQAATVKSVLSSDTLILRGKQVSPTQLPKERTLHLEGLVSPRMGNRDRADEPWAFESREYLRGLLVGKEIKFIVTHTVNTSTPPMEFGIAHASSPSGDVDIALATVKAGWAKVREGGAKGTSEEEGSRKALLKEAEEEARKAGKGQWGTPTERTVQYSMPEDPSAFLATHKGQQLDAIIEATPNGSTVRARLLLSPSLHQFVQIGIAGCRAPRAGNGSAEGGSSGEEFGDEARYFLETRLLQRKIKVALLSLPAPAVTPVAFNSTSDSAPIVAAAPTLFFGTIHHPAGNIAAHLVAAGLATVMGLHAGFLSQSATPDMMAELRKAEAEAKATRKNIWRSLPVPAVGAVAAQAAQEKDRKWDGVVSRVWGADQLSVIRVGETAERRLQLSSVRQPKPTDPKFAGLQMEGKELLRKKLIGKTVHVHIDYVKAADGDYEAKECATIKTLNGGNVAELLVDRGLVSVIRHRANDEQRSSEIDKLMAAEAKAVEAAKGLHSGKDYPVPRIIEVSASAQKAAPFLSSLKRSGRTPAVVDFVAAGSRFKVYLPKESVKLTLVLSGIRAPRTARNPSEKSEPFGQEAANFITRKCMQRDVEILVETVDKAGGFIGKMFLGNEDVAVLLVKEGLARIDEYAIDRVSKEITEAQEEAKRLKKNIWSNYDAAAEAATNGSNGKAAEPVAARIEYVDCMVTDVRGGEGIPFSFAIQILNEGRVPALESLMSELNLHHKEEANAPANFVPRMNDLVSVLFSDDNTWYRGRVRRSNPAKKEAEVLFVDFGNSDTVPFSLIRPMAPHFKTLDSQAKESTLSFVSLVQTTEYAVDALERFRELCEGRPLIANVDARESNLLHLSLFDPADPSSTTSHEASINVSLVREGLARIDTKSRFRSAYPGVVKALDEALRQAKMKRAGAYEMGDIFDDED